MKVLVKENKGNFIKEFTQNDIYISHCKYEIDVIEGCFYNCAYCFLKHFLNHDDIIFYKNIEKLRQELINNSYNYFNLSVLSDGSMLLYKEELVEKLFDIIEQFPEKLFEIRFKGANIINLLTLNPPKNIIFTATITPLTINKNVEIGTSNYKERLDVLEKFKEKGYKIGFIFDPIIKFRNYLVEYKEIASYIEEINLKDIFMCGFGVLRLEKHLFINFLEQINKTPLKGHLRGEFIIGEDGKYRYEMEERKRLYKEIFDIFKFLNCQRKIIYMEREEIEKELLH